MLTRALSLTVCLFLAITSSAQQTPTAALTASKPIPGAALGTSLAISGSTVAAIGGQQKSEEQAAFVVFVYTKAASASWTNMTESAILASPGDLNQQSVTMNGDASVIASTGSKGTYVYVRPSGGWHGTISPSAVLTFGPAPKSWVMQGAPTSISINSTGDTIVVGAPAAGYAAHRSEGIKVPASLDRGAAYVFVKPTNGWSNMTATAKLTASDAQAEDVFGSAVSISANTVLVGAPGVVNSTGVAYLYERPQTGIWVDSQRFRARFAMADEQSNDQFGMFTGIGNSGKLVVLGDAKGCGASNPGHALVYVRSQRSGWPASPSPTATLSPSDLAGGGCFGRVAVGGSSGSQEIVVGAPSSGTGGMTGSAYVFAEPVDGWTSASSPASALGGSGSVYFGYSGSVGGRTFAISAPNTTEDGVLNAGVIFLFSN